MTWKVYYTLPESTFIKAVNQMRGELKLSVEQDEESTVIFGEQVHGLEKIRATRQPDENGRMIVKIIGIIEDFSILSMLEPYFGSPTQIRSPKPSLIDFAHVVVSLRQLSSDVRFNFLLKNLGLSSTELAHYVTQLQASAKRSTAEQIIVEAVEILGV